MINKKKVLLIKRRGFPFIFNPGVWSFVFGGRESGEDYLETAYREIMEETAIPKRKLKLLYGPKKILETDEKRSVMFYNNFYIFRSSTDKVMLDMENSAYRWAEFSELKENKYYTNIFIDGKFILNKIKSCLNGSKKPKK